MHLEVFPMKALLKMPLGALPNSYVRRKGMIKKSVLLFCIIFCLVAGLSLIYCAVPLGRQS